MVYIHTHVCTCNPLIVLYVVYTFSPRFDIPAPDPQLQAKKMSIVCHICGEAGHKAVQCTLQPPPESSYTQYRPFWVRHLQLLELTSEVPLLRINHSASYVK